MRPRPDRCTQRCTKASHFPPGGSGTTPDDVVQHLRYFEREVTPADERPRDCSDCGHERGYSHPLEVLEAEGPRCMCECHDGGGA